MTLRVVLTLVVVALAVGCGGGADAPEGFTRFDSDTFAISHPEGWDVGQQGEGDSFTALGETGPQGIRQAAIVQIDPTYQGDFEVLVGGLTDLATVDLPEYRVLGQDDVDVEGAQMARLIESTYLGTGEGTEPTVGMHQFDLLAVNNEAILYYLRVNAPEELFDADAARQILDSFTLKG